MARLIGKRSFRLLAIAALLCSTSVCAQIKVGVVVSATGPAASLGIPEKNTIPLLPKEIGGKTVEYIVLDDATDSTTAVKNMRKLIAEDKVDVVVGSTTTPNSLAMIDVAAETETPMTPCRVIRLSISPKAVWPFPWLPTGRFRKVRKGSA